MINEVKAEQALMKQQGIAGLAGTASLGVIALASSLGVKSELRKTSLEIAEYVKETERTIIKQIQSGETEGESTDEDSA